jgi:hypothetical protein
MKTPIAHAAVDGATSSAVTLLDTNANGKIDRITFSILNTSLDTWVLQGASPYGLSVTDDGLDVALASVSITSAAAANPVTIQVNLNEGDADLDIDTSASAVELIYTAVTFGTCTLGATPSICDSDEELNAIATGDGAGAVNTEADGAAPVIYAGEYRDADVTPDGKIDALMVVFSETVTAASVLANNDLLLTSVGDFTSAAFGADATDLITGSVAFKVITLGTESTVVDTNNGGAAIAVSTQNAFSLTDGTNTNTTLGALGITFADAAGPSLKDAAYEDSDNDGKIDQFTFTFSESITASSVITAASLSLTGVGDFTSAAFGAGSTDLATGTVSSVSVPLGTESTVVDTASTSLTISSAGAFNLVDAATNSTGYVGAQAQLTFTDSAKPIIKTVEVRDTNTNGMIDRIDYIWSENVDTDDGAAPVAADLPTTLLPDGTAATFGSATLSDPAGASATLQVTGVTAQVTVNTGAGSTAISGDLSAKWKDAATVANAAHITGATANETISDLAAPVVSTVSPASAATGVSRTASIVITFSEAMTTTFNEATQFTITPNPTGTQSAVFSAGDTIVTIALPTLSCNTAYTVATAEATISASAGSPTTLVTTGPSTGDWSFTTTTSCTTAGGTGSGTSTPLTHSIAVNSPNGGQVYHAGDIVSIVWTGSNINTTNLSYATSTGGTYTAIASNLAGSGTYNWTVPDLTSSTVWIKAEGYDGSVFLASDTSDSTLSIVGTTTATPTPVPPQSQPTTGTGTSPLTGLPEVINVVSAGDVLRGEHYSTVYYIDANLLRRPFQDSQTYFTHYSSWATVRTVTDATLSTLTMGKPMLPKSGVVLVKIVSDPRVYALETSLDGLHEVSLRWVPSETVANTLYGSTWADYVIDIPSTIYTHFGHGSDMTGSDIVNRNIMQTRAFLNR